MFGDAGIEDGGIANWNTASLTVASAMFVRTRHLSESLDLSGWKFGPKPEMAFMFAESNIVDCGIGKWSVAKADVYNQLHRILEPKGAQLAATKTRRIHGAERAESRLWRRIWFWPWLRLRHGAHADRARTRGRPSEPEERGGPCEFLVKGAPQRGPDGGRLGPVFPPKP